MPKLKKGDKINVGIDFSRHLLAGDYRIKSVKHITQGNCAYIFEKKGQEKPVACYYCDIIDAYLDSNVFTIILEENHV